MTGNHPPTEGTKPPMPQEPWYDSNSPTRIVRAGSWRIGVWIICAVVFFGLLGAGIWAVRIATSDVRGRGDATVKVNSADNRLFAQGNFHDLYQDVLASDRKLDQAAADKTAHLGDAFWDTNYTGLRAHCEDTRAQYNAAARKISQAKFRDENLPAQLDDTDPKNDCKETSK